MGTDHNWPEHDGLRLLVLDDDPMTGETICRIARFSGAQARYTTSAEDFFRELDVWPPDMIALDLVMPDMDGVEVMAELGRRSCHAGLIITSGVGPRILEAASLSAREHGLYIAGVLAKPFSSASLRQLLTNPRPRQQRAATAAPVAQPMITEQALRQGLAGHQFSIALQPKVSCLTGTLAGFEVLARWQHPEQGVIAPDRFIPRAEELGLIDALTREITEQALAWLAGVSSRERAEQLRSHRLMQAYLSINISARSLTNSDLFEWIARRAREYGVAPSRVILELTESSAMSDPTTSLDTLTRLRMEGFRLSIDDFGTGYSSMLQLVRLPFSEIKVDKTFVMSVASSSESRAVIRSVIELGHSLGLSTTAEGVEDEAALAYLRELHCDEIQGYLIAAPMAGDAVIDWFVTRERQREDERLAALRDTCLLDSPAEPRFDRIARLAQRLFGVPIALISLIDANRQYFKSRMGVELQEISRDISLCEWTLEGDGVLSVPDTTRDARYADNPLVTGETGVRFYAGKPVCLPDGHKAGTLCIVDTRARDLSPSEIALLQELAAMVEVELASSSVEATDQLSGMHNRTAFRRQAEMARSLSRQLERPCALVIITLNHLGDVNRNLGRLQGDQLIAALSTIVYSLDGCIDVAGRYRGNELGLMMVDTTIAEVTAVCEALALAIRTWNQQQAAIAALTMACHIGVAWLDADATRDTEAAIEAARQPFMSIAAD